MSILILILERDCFKSSLILFFAATNSSSVYDRAAFLPYMYLFILGVMPVIIRLKVEWSTVLNGWCVSINHRSEFVLHRLPLGSMP